MKVKFWGVRGSIPCSHRKIIKYGGNTACVEVRNNNNELIIIDAGTGIRYLGNSLMAEFGKDLIEANILLSHTHWDHIQGLPFFIPFYIPTNKFVITGPQREHKTLKEILTLQMDHDYFPLNFESLPAQYEVSEILETDFEYKNFKIKTKILNHGGLGTVLAYKIKSDNKTIVYSSDHEAYKLFFDVKSERTKKMVEKLENQHKDFVKDADLIIHDTQYTENNYTTKKGWGHSTYEYLAELCVENNIPKGLTFHYDPDSTDKEIDEIVNNLNKKLKQNGNNNTEIIGTYEGLEINV